MQNLVWLTMDNISTIVSLGLIGTFSISFLLGFILGHANGYRGAIKDAKMHGQSYVTKEYERIKARKLEGY